MFCGNCGNEMRDHAKFCPKCGSKTDSFEVNQASSQMQSAPVNQVPLQVQSAPVNQAPTQVQQAPMNQAPPMTNQVPVNQTTIYQSPPSPNTDMNQNVQPLKTKGKSIIIAVLTLALVLTLTGILFLGLGGGAKETDIGFRTEQEVMEHFAKRIASGDLDAATRCFAINHRAENYDLGKMIERMRAWTPSMEMRYPSEDEVYLVSNKASLRTRAMMETANLCFGLEAGEEFFEGTPLQLSDTEYSAADIENLTKNINPQGFKFVSMEMAVDVWAREGNDIRESYNDNKKRVCEVYGAEDREEYLVRYEWNGEAYEGGVTLIKYDGQWYIENLGSVLLGTRMNMSIGKVE